MMFASKTPRDLLHAECKRAWNSTAHETHYAMNDASRPEPMPEWDDLDPEYQAHQLQNWEDDLLPPEPLNEPNPILVAFREEIDGGAGRDRYSWGAGCFVRYSEAEAFAHAVGYFLTQMEPMGGDPRLPRVAFGIDATPSHITHARAILTRLANLADKEQA